MFTDYFWCLLASIAAGVGTGFAGISAATVMVPVLLVLCPGFSGETGAYQATAIALASDILGSAVTTIIYAKHKNIDLKRGWIMCVCVLSMCTLGSYAAWLVGNVALGSFTLFLTFCIGIRFLAMPDTTRKTVEEKGSTLGFKEILISVLFGLPIGFGTGFVGTGGGMMMLVVFTAFLGMELKSSVGTSTFIMTFTALIASVSHVMIHPAIILEKWDLLLICVVAATVASLISARFANRVNNRTIGLITGAVLTVLGAAMLILNFWDYISQFDLFVQVLKNIRTFILFLTPCLIVLVPIYIFAKIPKFIFRKLLHIVAFTGVTVMLVTAETWQSAALLSLVLVIILYPVLTILEKENWYSNLFVEKSKGEAKKSLIILFTMFTVLIVISWGFFKKPYAGAAAILIWGSGDAMAALIGIPFGKHKIQWKFTDGKKSYEGSIAMLFTAFVCCFLILLFSGNMSLVKTIFISVLCGITGTLTELYSPSELDTITVPIAVLIPLMLLV